MTGPIPRPPSKPSDTPKHLLGSVAQPILPSHLNRKQAARYIGYAPKTLANWAVLGIGPRFTRPNGKALYALADLDLWLATVGSRGV